MTSAIYYAHLVLNISSGSERERDGSATFGNKATLFQDLHCLIGFGALGSKSTKLAFSCS